MGDIGCDGENESEEIAQRSFRRCWKGQGLRSRIRDHPICDCRGEEERHLCQGEQYHEDSGMKLELERSNGVCELMIDLRRCSMEDGTAEAMRAGNVECLQKERTWNLSHLM